jgi:hypothetical protein
MSKVTSPRSFSHRLQDFQHCGVNIRSQFLARQLGVPPDNLKRAADIAAQAVVEGIQIAAEVAGRCSWRLISS